MNANQPSTMAAKGMSKGMFLAMFLIPCILIYTAGLWLMPLTVLFAGVVGLMYVWMAVASFLRGRANGRKWAVVLPLTAGVIEVFIIYLFMVDVPNNLDSSSFAFLAIADMFAPTVLHVVALVVGMQGRKARPAPVNALTGGMACALVLGAAVLGTATATAEGYVPLFVRASHPSQQGFVRIVNHSGKSGKISIWAVDDAGNQHGQFDGIDIGPWQAMHFNSADLEDGNEDKGLDGFGPGHGDWVLSLFGQEVDSRGELLDTALDNLEVLAYVRHADGFLTSIHDVGRRAGKWHLVPVFNPASNANQVSKLRLIDEERLADDDDVYLDDGGTVRIVGVDDSGHESKEVSLFLRYGRAVTVTAQQLEGGDPGFLTGALGDGQGKWSLYISSDYPITVMNLMESGGRLTNLSTSNAAPHYGPPSVETSFAALPKQMDPSDWSFEHGGTSITVEYLGAKGETYEIRMKESSAFTWPHWEPASKNPVAGDPGYYTHESSGSFGGSYDIQMRAINEAGIGPASDSLTLVVE